MQDWLRDNKDKVKIASSTNIVEYLRQKTSIIFKKEGSKYFRDSKNKKHVYCKNMYYHNDTGDTGDTIQYLVNHLNYDFQGAVNELLIFNNQNPTLSSKKFEELVFKLDNMDFVNDKRKAIAYLTKTRGLSQEIIKFLMSINYLNQTKDNNNIAFIMMDEEGNPVGAELNTSLSNRRYKGVSSGSKYGYGFNIVNTNKPKSALYFESAIDLLSFADHIGFNRFIDKTNTSLFCSMAGLKKNVIENMQKVYKNPDIFLCIDNPEFEEPLPDGRKPTQKFIDEIKEDGFINFKVIKSEGYKDWNDLIKKNRRISR